MSLPLRLLSTLIVVSAACNSPSTSAPTPTKPPLATAAPTDRALPLPDPREAKLALAVTAMLEREHLVRTPIDDALSKQAFAEFLTRTDPGKAYLLASHVDELRAHEMLMDDELSGGDLVLGRLAAQILLERQAVIAKIVSDALAAPFDFTVDESMDIDEEKIPFATTEAELADRWRKSLKLQALERVARMEESRASLTKALATAKTAEEKTSLGKAIEKIPDTDKQREEAARGDLAKSYDGRFSRLAKQESLESVESFVNAIASVFDPHTVYLAPAEQENFEIQMSGSLEGIGAVLQEDDHYIRVSEIVPGGASDRQGQLKAGDLIMSVAQHGEDPVDVADMRINQVVAMIRGPKNSLVTLTVKKADDRIETISITRDVVEIEASYARGAIIDMGAGKSSMGLVYLPSFYANSRGQRDAAGDVAHILDELRKQQVGGVILDLRGNGGGLLDQARDISGLFFPTGPVVQTRESDGDIEVLIDRDKGVSFAGNVVVLVDRFSASASEIVAAALQDYGRALVVGTATHGKGTVQTLIDMDSVVAHLSGVVGDAPFGVLKLTIQQFFRINGGSTQWRGVIPDIALPDPAAHIESGERFLDHAIKWSEIQRVDYTPVKGSWSIEALAKKSAARVAARPVFAKVASLGELAKARRARTTISLKRDVWQAQRDADEKALEAADPKIGEGPELLKLKVVRSSVGKDEGVNGRINTWRDSVARDPWLAESIAILADMATP